MTYWVCSDHISGSEQADIQAVINKLKAAGKDAQNGGVGPNKEALRNSKPEGDVVVFMVGGGQAGATWSSFAKGYQAGMAKTMIAYCGWSGSDAVKCERAKSDELVIEHDAGGFYQSWMDSMIDGETVVTFVQKYSDCFEGFCCSNVSADDLGSKIANGSCGNDSEDDSSESYTTIKDALKELLSYWDGEVECKVRGDTVYVNKIPNPEGNCTRLVKQGYNVIADSATVTDLSPVCPNKINVIYGNGKLTVRDEKLIERFGVIEKEVEAKKYVKTGQPREASVEEHITSRSEALAFGRLYLRQMSRDNGRVVECKVIGSPEWRVGEWTRVILPLFGIDDYMYISKVSTDHSSDEWACNISLVDYPPGFGEYEEENTSTDDETAEGTTAEEVAEG